MHPRAIDRQHRDIRQTSLRAEPENLPEERRQRTLVTLAKPGDRRVIGLPIRRDDAERDVLKTAALDHPRRALPARVGIDEQRDHLSSTGRRNAVWPVTLKLGSDELTFWVTAAVVVEARPEGGPERR